MMRVLLSGKAPAFQAGHVGSIPITRFFRRSWLVSRHSQFRLINHLTLIPTNTAYRTRGMTDRICCFPAYW